VGGGMAGLAAAAYLSKDGFNVLLIEKGKECGGLLNSFERDGFTFDAGARSIENSGIIRPMLQQLGIEMELLESPVSIGLEKSVINVKTLDDFSKYKQLLEEYYPESPEDVQKISSFIQKILKHMAILYGLDNPLFKDLKKDKEFLKQMLPWFGKFLGTISKINKMQEPVEPFLEKMLTNRSLIDIIDQHFFKNTPTFFALGYFYVYLDYFYPKGGTGMLPRTLQNKILEWGGQIITETDIIEVNASEKTIKDSKGKQYKYDNLIWAADLKSLYRILQYQQLPNKVQKQIEAQKRLLMSKRGGDSVFSMFTAVNWSPEKFKAISNGHFFYTPSKQGLGEIHRSIMKDLIAHFSQKTKEEILNWLSDYCRYNTYEISIPSLRDSSLSPPSKTGLIVSFLFEYDLIKKIQDAGWYDEFKSEVENRMIETLSNSIYPGLKENILFKFSSTPITIATMTGNSDGAITGWSFESEVPAINRLTKIPKAIFTPIPNILQAGQWTYSPAGIPISLITGTTAAREIMK
jgi:all-trans-retinol 13,14-reductase